MQPLERAQAIYAAFGRGDVPAILEHLSADVEWEYGIHSTDVPWLQPRRGREGAAAFFASLSALNISRFELKSLLTQGNIVVALCDLEATVKATGKRISEIDEVHIWTFNDRGLVERFRHRLDTHQHFLALRG